MLREKESFCSGFILICFFSAQISDTTDFLYRKSFFTAETFLLYKVIGACIFRFASY